MIKLHSNYVWDRVDWPSVKKPVFKTQRRIYKARFNGNKEHIFLSPFLYLPSNTVLRVNRGTV